MIDPSPQRLIPWLPLHTVIESATGKESYRGEGEDAQGDPAAELVGYGDHGQAGDEGDRRHDEVDKTSEPWFWRLRGGGRR